MPVAEPTLPVLKGTFPFRLGTSSYIIPADIEPNVHFLAPLLDDIELVLFESDEFSNLPGPEVIETLAELKAEHQLSYTVHLPLDCRFGHPNPEVRAASVGKCERIIDLVRPLDPHAYLVHFDGEVRAPQPAANMDAWRDRLRESAEALIACDVPSRKLAVETLQYPFECVTPVVHDLDLGVCVDIGHLLLLGRDPAACVREHRKRCCVVHLHGVRDGTDHVDIADMDGEVLSGILAAASVPGPDCVVTLELFGRETLEPSLHRLAREKGQYQRS